MPRPDVPEAVTRLADEVLFPAALATDAADVVPVELLDRFAEAGLYGLAGPPDAGGLGIDLPGAVNVIEVLAGGCLTTTFVWLQHQGPVLTMAYLAPQVVRDEWLGPLCRGEKRGGVALAGTLPGPPRLTVEETADGWLLDGSSPWVTGWGRIDVLQVVARDPDDNLVTLLVDARPAESLCVEPLPMVALNASATVGLRFDRHLVPAGRFVRAEPYTDFLARDPAGLRLNGSLALGVAGRCCSLIGPGALDDELDACRRRLDDASPEELPAARAAACELASRTATACIVAEGSGAVLRTSHAQRLAREAMFLLVFGQRPTIRSALLDLLGAPGVRP